MPCCIVGCEQYDSNEKGFCEADRQMMARPDLYTPVMCWNCGAIVWIHKRPQELKAGEVLFCINCRRCAAGSTVGEKKYLNTNTGGNKEKGK